MDVMDKDVSNPFHQANSSERNAIGILDPINSTYSYDKEIDTYLNCNTGII